MNFSLSKETHLTRYRRYVNGKQNILALIIVLRNTPEEKVARSFIYQTKRIGFCCRIHFMPDFQRFICANSTFTTKQFLLVIEGVFQL